MKKLFAMALATIMALALSVPAFAADITVTNAHEGDTYKLYQIFDYTTAGENSYAYTIKANSPWKNLVENYKVDEQNVFELTAPAGDASVLVVTINSDGNGGNLLDSDSEAAAFAAYLNENIGEIAEDKTVVADASGAEFTGLNAGYYFVDTSLGSLCALFNSDTSQQLIEKNAIPTLKKEVKEDSTDVFGAQADADIQQDVTFKLTVNVGSNRGEESLIGTGIVNDFVITDTLPSGMTYIKDSINIENWNLDTDYTLAVAGKVLTITLKGDKLVALDEAADVEITYDANVDNVALIDAANTNTAVLQYGEYETDEVSADVYTYDLEIFKHNEAGQPLANAEFVLKNADGKFAQTEAVVAAEGVNVYTFSAWVDDEADATTFVSPASGKINIQGLDADTYTLVETKAPAGYNLVESIPAITLSLDNKNADQDVTVLNVTGQLLPSTGGIGTTIFYTVGGMLVVAAGVLLVTKKRMSGIEE